MVQPVPIDAAKIRPGQIRPGGPFTRPLLLVAVAAILVNIAIALAGIWWLHALAVSNSRRELTNLAFALSDQTERALGNAELRLRRLAVDALQQSEGPMRNDQGFTKLQAAARELVESSLEIDALKIEDAGGDTVLSAGVWPEGETGDAGHNVAQNGGQNGGQNTGGDDNHSDIVIDPQPGSKFFTIRLEIRRADGAVEGAVVARISAEAIAGLADEIDLGADSAVTIIRDDGVVLVRTPDTGRAIGKAIPAAPRCSSLQLGKCTSFSRETSAIDGLQRFVVSQRIDRFPLTLRLSQTVPSALLEWRRHALVVLIGAAVTTAILGLVTALSLSQLRRREQLSRDALNQAVRASQAKSSFLANMSHELRTPLNAIIGYSEMMMLKSFGPEIGDAYVERVRIVHDSGKHLLSLINDLLDLARIEAGKFKLRIETLDCEEIVSSCLSVVSAEAGMRRVTLASEVARDLPPIQADRRALVQILLNLLSNALKSTPPEGRVLLSAAAPGPTDVVFSVIDTGIGIAAPELARIFEPFQSGDPVIRRPNAGAGLGLAITQELVRLHGGTIAIASEPGVGTCVEVRLPLAPRAGVQAGIRVAPIRGEAGNDNVQGGIPVLSTRGNPA